MQDNIPDLKYSIAIVLLLLIPFLMKALFEEPYPAVIFPSGQTVISLEKKYIENTEYEFFVKKDSSLILVNEAQLFGNIPSVYYRYLVKNKMGFYPVFYSQNQYNQIIHPWLERSPKKTDELISFYLKNLNMEVDSLFIYEYSVKRSISTGEIEGKELSVSYKYNLK
jgi:hypothetical protein